MPPTTLTDWQMRMHARKTPRSEACRRATVFSGSHLPPVLMAEGPASSASSAMLRRLQTGSVRLPGNLPFHSCSRHRPVCEDGTSRDGGFQNQRKHKKKTMSHFLNTFWKMITARCGVHLLKRWQGEGPVKWLGGLVHP